MKHIVHVSNDFEPLSSGINTHLQNLLPELSKSDFKVTLLVPTASSEIDCNIFIDHSWRYFTCVRVHYPRTRNLFLKLFNLTKATKAGLQWIEEKMGIINLIHQHDNRATRIGAIYFARRNSIPIIWTNHSSGFFEKANLPARMMTYIPGICPDGVVVVHRILLEKIQKFFDESLVKYIPNGVNVNHFSMESKGSGEAVIILFPQRMIAQKGVETFAQAVKILTENKEELNLKFWFAGSEEESNRDSNLIKDVKKLFSTEMKWDKVRFLGNLPYSEMSTFYQIADIVVLPLQVETENISVFEAWASGTPLITTEQVEKNGYMKHEENCLIVPNKDSQKLAEAIVRLANDSKLRETLAVNGRKLVENRFTWTQAARKTANFYREILNEGSE